MNFVPAVAYLFCLNLPAAFLQPGNSLIEIPCIVYKWHVLATKKDDDPAAEERIAGGRGNCIVFRGSKISRPLILFPGWKMRQRKNGEGRKKEERTKQIYLNAVLRRKKGRASF